MVNGPELSRLIFSLPVRLSRFEFDSTSASLMVALVLFDEIAC